LNPARKTYIFRDMDLRAPSLTLAFAAGLLLAGLLLRP
jgi:hypothetical protein